MAKKPGNTRDPLRDCAGTPVDRFAVWHARFSFTVDACALPYNAKLPRYWAPPGECIRAEENTCLPLARDGLTQSWANERVWCNPPYGKGLIAPWVEKALGREGPLSVLLLPCRTEMPWFHSLNDNPHVEIDFLRYRVQFDAPPNLGQDFKKTSNFERSFLAVVR